jgi:hypothetical protein
MRLNLGVQHSDWPTPVSNAALRSTSYNVYRCSTTSETSAQHILVAVEDAEWVNWRPRLEIVALQHRWAQRVKLAMFWGTRPRQRIHAIPRSGPLIGTRAHCARSDMRESAMEVRPANKTEALECEDVESIEALW